MSKRRNPYIEPALFRKAGSIVSTSTTKKPIPSINNELEEVQEDGLLNCKVCGVQWHEHTLESEQVSWRCKVCNKKY